MTLHQYAQKWQRPDEDTLAVACYEDSSLYELLYTGEEPDETAMKTCGITDPKEWRDAINAALETFLETQNSQGKARSADTGNRRRRSRCSMSSALSHIRRPS
jgi:hypothetical protein